MSRTKWRKRLMKAVDLPSALAASEPHLGHHALQHLTMASMRATLPCFAVSIVPCFAVNISAPDAGQLSHAGGPTGYMAEKAAEAQAAVEDEAQTAVTAAVAAAKAQAAAEREAAVTAAVAASKAQAAAEREAAVTAAVAASKAQAAAEREAAVTAAVASASAQAAAEREAAVRAAVAAAVAAANAQAAAEREAALADHPVEIVRKRARESLRCSISHKSLEDPARGDKCRHAALCNYDELRAFAARRKICPIIGCTAKIPRTRDVVRDDAVLACEQDLGVSIDLRDDDE
jgi:hypothetical protein